MGVIPKARPSAGPFGSVGKEILILNSVKCEDEILIPSLAGKTAAG